MATTNGALPNEPICPLARDEDGHAIELPTGSVGWRVRRKTGGRPRLVLGADKQPMQLSLSYSVVDLEDILTPGEYLLDLVDLKGAPVGVTVPALIGTFRNADGDDDKAEDAFAVATQLPTSGSETRLVLEANVRATQMAFLHNQKTLELGLRMAESLRDGVRVMAESQADWIKSISSARGFFRNARPQLPEPPRPREETRDEDDGDDDDEPDSPPEWVEAITPLVTVVAQQVAQAFTTRGERSGAAATKKKLELADVIDWRRAAAKAETAAPPAELSTVLAKLPPALLSKLVEVRALLDEDEQQCALRLIAQLDAEGIAALAKSAETMTTEQLAAFVRHMLAKPAA